MIQLPDLRKDPKATADLCKCRPICKSRRREWRGETQNTSAELLLERKPPPECFRRWPKKVYPNCPCPLFGRTRRVIIKPRDEVSKPKVVRICQAPVDDQVDTPYLKYAEIAKRLVNGRCAFCPCGGCCPCGTRDYASHDGERATVRAHNDMREFDARVKQDYMEMRIMYDKP
ncbi:unnamed protein product [Diatraea saccharalis]|uniref:Uncharacterized protein n=1 Tax=Diatraea saccharalis TaxID=40085 RepID=A0A9N9QZR0_9NEOP|nr:unnamed protein product [Diatraea saccharalis]